MPGLCVLPGGSGLGEEAPLCPLSLPPLRGLAGSAHLSAPSPSAPAATFPPAQSWGGGVGVESYYTLLSGK